MPVIGADAPGLAPSTTCSQADILDRLAGNRTQHKRFSDELAAVLARYSERQITSAQVVTDLVALAKRLREQHRREEDLGLSREEVAFYDALAGQGDDFVQDPRLKDLAVELVPQIRRELAVDWTERGNLEARIRRRIRHLLRGRKDLFATSGGGGDLDQLTERVFLQARALYERWPEVEGSGFAA